MPCYQDDLRVAACAIPHYTGNGDKYKIYRDLLCCHYRKYIDDLEYIADNTEYRSLHEWGSNLIASMDIFGDEVFKMGDMACLEQKAWKLKVDD